jgi:Raf kinase inhibitor-like YbhB/YbcL family protein
VLLSLGAPACATKGPAAPARLEVTSSALTADGPVPAAYACSDDEHLGKSPPLAWSAGPPGTIGYAVTVVDPDAKGFVHWALLGLPASVTSLPEGASPGGSLPVGAVELPNDFERRGYGGPCPPPGALHHYELRVTALKAKVSGATGRSLFRALDDNALASGTLVATFKR